jgi:hypothetical protein
VTYGIVEWGECSVCGATEGEEHIVDVHDLRSLEDESDD